MEKKYYRLFRRIPEMPHLFGSFLRCIIFDNRPLSPVHGFSLLNIKNFRIFQNFYVQRINHVPEATADGRKLRTNIQRMSLLKTNLFVVEVNLRKTSAKGKKDNFSYSPFFDYQKIVFDSIESITRLDW